MPNPELLHSAMPLQMCGPAYTRARVEQRRGCNTTLMLAADYGE